MSCLTRVCCVVPVARWRDRGWSAEAESAAASKSGSDESSLLESQSSPSYFMSHRLIIRAGILLLGCFIFEEQIKAGEESDAWRFEKQGTQSMN